MSTDTADLQLKFDASGRIVAIDDLHLDEKEQASIAELLGSGEVKVQEVLAAHGIDRTAILTRREWSARDVLERAADYRRQMVEAAGKIDIRLGTEADAKFICDQAGKVLHDATVKYATVVRQCAQFGLACPPPLRLVRAHHRPGAVLESTDDDSAAERASRDVRERRDAERRAAKLHMEFETILGPYKEQVKELFEAYYYDCHVENLAHLLASLESVRRLRQQPDRAVRTALDPDIADEARDGISERRAEEGRGEHAHLDAGELAALDCWLQRSVLATYKTKLNGGDEAAESEATGSDSDEQH